MITHKYFTGYCSIPSNNPLWKRLGLSPLPSDSVRACYKGEEETCHKDRRSVPKGCLWWHFHPNERVKDLNSGYSDIMQRKSVVGQRSFLSQILKGFQNKSLRWVFSGGTHQYQLEIKYGKAESSKWPQEFQRLYSKLTVNIVILRAHVGSFRI